MEESKTPVSTGPVENKPFQLNVKRTMWIAVAFFGILLVWGIYNSYCANFLTFLFAEQMFGLDSAALSEVANADKYLQVQWIVGIIMALDNVAALFLMPIFGRLSDKTHTKLGKRMPYILVGTVITAIALPFIPLFFDLASNDHISMIGGIIGLIATMLIVLCVMMMYRSPAVALMPDLTPKPLRSKANGIINIVGYVGGALAVVFGMFMPFSSYVSRENTTTYHNFWYIEIPFIVASVILLVSMLLLLWKVHENEIAAEMKDEMARGDAMGETVDKVDEDAPMSKANKRNLILILVAEFLWFMSFNAIETFASQYTMFYLDFSTSFKSTLDLISGVCSAIMFVIGGFIADKIGRKHTIQIGLAIVAVAYIGFACIPTPIDSVDYTYSWSSTFFSAPVAYTVGFGLIFMAVGAGSAMIHICSYPLVVDFCNSKHIGKFTSYYYAASMGAQSITPIVIGAIMSTSAQALYAQGNTQGMVALWRALPIYSAVLMCAAFIVFAFVKAPHTQKGSNAKGLEALGADD